MYRLTITFLFVFLLVRVDIIQGQVISGKIIDSQSQQHIPYAHILIQGGFTGTVSNNDGGFVIPIDSVGQVLVFSHVSYITKEIKMSAFLAKDTLYVKLIPRITQLDEIIVSPRDAKDIIQNALSQGLKNLKYKSHADLFYRQTTKIEGVPSELVEVFYDGIISPAGVQSMEMVQGRFARVPEDSSKIYPSLINFYFLSSMPAIQKKVRDLILPIGYSGDTDPPSGDVDPLGGSRFKELDGLTILPFFS